MKKYFITAIGTNSGKTIISAILVEKLKADYYKPIQTGYDEDVDSETVNSLVSNNVSKIFESGVMLKAPASPHQAAIEEGKNLLLSDVILPESTNDILIIEGAGGVLVPLNLENEYIIDLSIKFDAEIILVINYYLGSINHTLLTLDYLIKNNYPLKGVIFNGIENEMSKRAILNKYPTVNIIGVIPQLENLSKESILEATQYLNI